MGVEGWYSNCIPPYNQMKTGSEKGRRVGGPCNCMLNLLAYSVWHVMEATYYFFLGT